MGTCVSVRDEEGEWECCAEMQAAVRDSNPCPGKWPAISCATESLSNSCQKDYQAGMFQWSMCRA